MLLHEPGVGRAEGGARGEGSARDYGYAALRAGAINSAPRTRRAIWQSAAEPQSPSGVTITSLRQTSESLDRLVEEIEQNPQALVSKPPAKEVQVKP